MEDSHLIHHDFAVPTETQWPSKNSDPEVRRLHLFSIFDGHGGSQVAKFAAVALIDELDRTLQFHEGKIENLFRQLHPCQAISRLRSKLPIVISTGFSGLIIGSTCAQDSWLYKEETITLRKLGTSVNVASVSYLFPRLIRNSILLCS